MVRIIMAECHALNATYFCLHGLPPQVNSILKTLIGDKHDRYGEPMCVYTLEKACVFLGNESCLKINFEVSFDNIRRKSDHRERVLVSRS